MIKKFLKWYNSSLKHKIFLLLSLCMITPLFMLSTINYKITLGTLENNINKLAQQDIEKLSYYFYGEMIDFFNLAYYCSQDNTIVNSIVQAQKTGDFDSAYSLINQSIIRNEITRRTRYPFEYMFILSDGSIISRYNHSKNTSYDKSSKLITQETWFKDLTNISVYSTRAFTHYDYLSELGGDTIYIARNIVSDSETIGVVVIGFSSYYISRLLDNSKVSQDSSIYIIDDKGECIAEGEDNPVKFSEVGVKQIKLAFDVPAMKDGRRYIDISGKKQMISGYKFPMVDLFDRSWYMVMVTPLQTVMKEVTYIRYVTAILIFVSFLALLLLLLLLKKYILNPISSLNTLMFRVRNGDTHVYSKIESLDEIGQLSDGFNEMVRDLNLNIENIHREEEEKRQLELKMLQSQINPHFVRNTLNVIRWMAELKRAEGISRALLSFTRLVDYNISGTLKYVLLKDEISNIEEYINIQKLRFGNRFSSSINIEEEVMKCRLLKLSLQPIVENCIIHGFQNIAWHGEIHITAQRSESNLKIVVSDNGRGINAEQVASLLCEDIPLNSTDRYGNIGLPNVQKRIKLNFGENYGINIVGKENEGTTVTIILPFLIDDEISKN